MPRLSIITPIFNSADYLEQLLESVAAVPGDVEHIVMDGGSEDGTVELLTARGDRRVKWRSEPDRGQTHAVNKGLATATGDILNWINGDNAYLPGAVQRALELLDARPEVDAVFGGIDFIDEHGHFRRRYVPGAWSWRRYLYVGDYVPTETIFFRRRLLDRVPGLDERFADAADYDFYLRLLHQRTVVVVREPLILYRYHPDSKTARDPWLAQGEHRVIRAGWARRPADRALMTAIDTAKRTLLPRVSDWPRPYPAD